ncbi:ATP-dependent DNA helicase RecQ-like [Halichondria panicea]|uniref:ATP-dependent DNA helicase RecQ-like n=1 Tax=Halichondria panicea TaxID=6063 RepID=UPI00312BA5F7
MAISTSFDIQEALAYALSCVKQEGLILKEQQVRALKLLSEGRDVFVWFPTGYGKSLCYQLLPFLMDYKLGRTKGPLVARSVVFVISPLVSLMIDQVRSLNTGGVSAAILSSNKGIDRSLVATNKDVSDGKYCLLFTAPEAVVEDYLSLEDAITRASTQFLFSGNSCGRSTLCLQVEL